MGAQSLIVGPIPRPSSYPLLGPKYPLLGNICLHLRVLGVPWYSISLAPLTNNRNPAGGITSAMTGNRLQDSTFFILACRYKVIPTWFPFGMLLHNTCYISTRKSEHNQLQLRPSFYSPKLEDFSSLLAPKAPRAHGAPRRAVVRQGIGSGPGLPEWGSPGIPAYP